MTGKLLSNPNLRVIRRSSSSTFAPSPSNSERNDACVPVVPFTPRNFSVATRYSSASKSIAKSCAQSVARLPTVVNWAGWKWV